MTLTREQLLQNVQSTPSARPSVHVPTSLELLARQLSGMRDSIDVALGLVLGMLEQQTPQDEPSPNGSQPLTFGAARSGNEAP